MKISEYKKLGLTFVAGDKRTSFTPKQGDVVMGKVSASLTNLNSDVDNEEIIAFAWRDGFVMPDYMGVVKVDFGFNVIETGTVQQFDWKHVVEWKPVVIGVAAPAPVPAPPEYTQEMFEAGEFPPIYSLCRIKVRGDELPEPVKILYVTHGHTIYRFGNEDLHERTAAVEFKPLKQPIKPEVGKFYKITNGLNIDVIEYLYSMPEGYKIVCEMVEKKQ